MSRHHTTQSAMAEPAPKRKRPYRKALHACRREEIEELNAELRTLEATFLALQKRAETVNERDEAADDERAKFLGRILRSAVQRQQREATPTLRLLSEYAFFDVRSGSPIHEIIHMPRDPTERRELLMGLRGSVVRRAEEFLRSRFAWVDPRVMVRDHQSFEAPNGDFCLAHVGTYQFAGSATVRGVFDSVAQYFRNIEIVLSELGSVTIREDDQHGDGGASQNRLVALTSRPNLVIESNYAVFSSFDDENESTNDEIVHDEYQQRRKKGYGMIVFDFIERDELYPYQPDRRARRDANAIFEVTARTRPRSRGGRRFSRESKDDESKHEGHVHEIDNDENDDEEEEIVTVIHWANMRLHRPAFPLPEGGWHELREISERWVSSLRFALREIYVPPEGGVM